MSSEFPAFDNNPNPNDIDPNEASINLLQNTISLIQILTNFIIIFNRSEH